MQNSVYSERGDDIMCELNITEVRYERHLHL